MVSRSRIPPPTWIAMPSPTAAIISRITFSFFGLPATALALTLGGPAAFAAVPSHLTVLLPLGIASTALPILLFMRLIRRAGPTRASMVGYLVPVWATILAVLFLGERIGAREMIGGAVVLAGVALVSFSGRFRLTAR